MTNNKPHVVIALVGKRIERDDYTEVGTILMGEYPSKAQADKERDRRNALVLQADPCHLGREYISMSAAEYVDMEGEE